MIEHSPISPENPNDREALLAAAHRLTQAQAELRDQMRNYARNSLLTAEQTEQAFPAECARLETVVAELQGQMVSGTYSMLSYYRDDPAHPEGDKSAVPFGTRMGSWRRPKQFIGVLAGFMPITHRRALSNDATVEQLVLAIDPATALPDGPERTFYLRNYRSDQLEQPFADIPEFAGRVYLLIDAVADLDIDYAYLRGQEYGARFLGHQATSDIPHHDA